MATQKLMEITLKKINNEWVCCVSLMGVEDFTTNDIIEVHSAFCNALDGLNIKTKLKPIPFLS